MKVNRPGSPLSSGAEPLVEPTDIQEAVKSERFAAALSQLEAPPAGTGEATGAASATRAALAEIARGSDLTTGEGAATAVRESARYMIRSRLGERFREAGEGEKLIADLSEHVAQDPSLKKRILRILQRMKAT